MYTERLWDKLSEQAAVYQALKENDFSSVCYREHQDERYGTEDANYTNRLRFSYYLLYGKAGDEETIARLFQEELKDRENNSFQGIGDTIQILTCLLQQYNKDHKYDELFARAKNANFDCACGYDPDVRINDCIETNNLSDCMELCIDLDYKDIMEEFVASWKESVEEWNEINCNSLIRFHVFLGKKEENEPLYIGLLESAMQKGDTKEILTAYRGLIQYYLDLHKYEAAYRYLKAMLDTVDYGQIREIRMFADFLEAGFELICNCPDVAESLWRWAKQELEGMTDLYGNLYKKAIAAAKAVHDPYEATLTKEYEAWKKKMGI